MTIIYFIIILGITVMIHELGHFIFAKKAGVYVYEFSIGMGPRLFKFNRKNDETEYSIRLLPIGGYVSMAGEHMEEDSKIPKDKQLVNKRLIPRFLTMFAGILFNFLLAIFLLFIIALISGSPVSTPEIDYIDPTYEISNTNLKQNDIITKINNKKISNKDDLLLELQINNGKTIEMEVNNNYTVTVSPTLVIENGESIYRYGFSLKNEYKTGFLNALIYAFTKTLSLVKQLMLIIFYLITGKLSLNNLSGPIGIYSVVAEVSKTGILNILYLIAYLCINVGFINLLPIPAFDGCRILFLIIEKIKGSKVNQKVENMVHSIGFVFLMILMVLITYNDIIRIFIK